MTNYYELKTHVSNSMLGWLKKSPAYYLSKISGDTEERENKSFENGKLVHKYLESPDSFIIEDFNRPTDKALDFLNSYYIYKDLDKAKEHSGHGWSSKQLNEKVLNSLDGQKYSEFLDSSKDKLILSKNEKYILDNVVKNIKKNPIIAPIIYDNEDVLTEYEIYWDKQIPNGSFIPCKGKLDKIKLDHKRKKIRIIDYKTTSKTPYGKLVKVNCFSDAQLDFIGTGWFSSFLKYDYYRQAGMYVDAVKHKFADYINSGYTIEFIFIVIELNGTFDLAIYSVSDQLLGYGLMEQQDLLTQFHFYQTTGDWSTPLSYNRIIQV